MKNSHLLPIPELNVLASSSSGCEYLAQSFHESVLSDKFKIWVGSTKNKQIIHENLIRNQGKRLSGLLVGVKDIIASKEFPTQMGNEKAWSTSTLEFDARVIDKLKSQGAVVVGKTSTSELAVHASNATKNPRYKNRTPGTSSTGSAAAVAAGHVSIAIATQTAGSIARPSSYCGVIGFKPSFGTLPRTGILKTTDVFDSVGLIGHRVSDIKTTFDAIRISGSDHPTHKLESSEYQFDRIIEMSGDNFDRVPEFLSLGTRQYIEMLAIKKNLSVTKSTENIIIDQIREAHTLIYRRDLSYYLREELKSSEITETMRQFLGNAESISNQNYRNSLEFISSWRKKYFENISDAVVISIAANSSAPKEEEFGQIDCNSLITSSHGPQITIPVLRDEDGRVVNISLSARWGMDYPLLCLAEELFGYSALDVESFVGKFGDDENDYLVTNSRENYKI